MQDLPSVALTPKRKDGWDSAEEEPFLSQLLETGLWVQLVPMLASAREVQRSQGRQDSAFAGEARLFLKILAAHLNNLEAAVVSHNDFRIVLCFRLIYLGCAV